MTRFTLIWAGQLVSSLGSGVSAFALAVSLYRTSGDIRVLAAIAIAVFLPQVVIGPFAGTLADRLDRRRLMLAADVGSAIATIVMAVCAIHDLLDPVSATLLAAASSACNAIGWPAYESATVALVPRPQLDRANGLVELSRGASQLLAPIIAGSLLSLVGLGGILIIDVISFGIAIATLLVVRIPAHRESRARQTWSDLAQAWRMVTDRSGLVAMLILFAITSLTFAVVDVTLKPLVLAFAEPWQLGIVLSTVGVGMVVGSLALAAWGGPRRRIAAILAFQLVEGGALVVAGAQPTFGVLVASAFAYGIVIPLTFGCARTIWQTTLPAAVQGRVSALRNAVVMLAVPLGYAAAIPLAARLDLRLVIVAMGVATCASAIATFLFRPYRMLEAG